MNTILPHTYGGSMAAVLLLFAMLGCARRPATDAHFITLKAGDMTATFCPYGARLVSLEVPGKDDQPVNVVWGFASEQAYRNCKTDPYYGAIIGRYGNRIAHGRFTLEGKNYQLDTNDHGNTLHGGPAGLHTKDWAVQMLTDSSVTFACSSPDGEGGFPGKLDVQVTYTLTKAGGLKVSYTAKTDKPTVVNLTNHAYWNLNGPGNGNILKHQLVIRADRYTPVDSLLIPTGRLDSVAGTPFNFTRGRAIGVGIADHQQQLHNGKGYDHNFVLNPHGPNTMVAQVTGDQSGIMMQVFTDQPGLQFYSGNFMAGKNSMNGGARDTYRSGFCLETQHFPDSPNKPGFPSTVLQPGQTYRSTTLYQFSH